MSQDKTAQIGQGFAERLRSARAEAGLTIRELAKRVGITHQSIVSYEGGRGGGARIDTIHALAEALQVSPCWLAYGIGPQRDKRE